MKIENCPKHLIPPEITQYPFNKFWKARCPVACGNATSAHKKKSDTIKSWNENCKANTLWL